MAGESSRTTEKVTAVVTAISAVVTTAAFFYAVDINKDANARLARETQEEFVRHVSLQEAPQYACKNHSGCRRGGVQWVLVNRNAIQLSDVWVEGPDWTVNMFNVPACSMYSIPVGFVPVAAHVEDAHGRWRVPREGTYEPSDRLFPKQDTDDAPWANDVANCP